MTNTPCKVLTNFSRKALFIKLADRCFIICSDAFLFRESKESIVDGEYGQIVRIVLNAGYTGDGMRTSISGFIFQFSDVQGESYQC